MPDYFRYDEKKKRFFIRDRPKNQSQVPVLKKIAIRLQNLVDENPSLSLTELQELFVRKVLEEGGIQLKKEGIDIAHHIAINVLMDEIVNRMNDPTRWGGEEFVEDLLSTDDSFGKRTAKEFFEMLRDATLEPEKKVDMANDVVHKWNQASANLIPGYFSPNRSISNNRDPHVILGDDGSFVETPRATRLKSSANKFLMYDYKPKSRESPENVTEYQSSSIHKDKDEAWSTIRVHSPLLPSDSESDADDTENDADETGISHTESCSLSDETSSNAGSTEHDIDDTDETSYDDTESDVETVESNLSSLHVKSEVVKKSESHSLTKSHSMSSLMGGLKKLSLLAAPKKKNADSLSEEKPSKKEENKNTGALKK